MKNLIREVVKIKALSLRLNSFFFFFFFFWGGGGGVSRSGDFKGLLGLQAPKGLVIYILQTEVFLHRFFLLMMMMMKIKDEGALTSDIYTMQLHLQTMSFSGGSLARAYICSTCLATIPLESLMTQFL